MTRNVVTFRIVEHGSPEYGQVVALREAILRTPLGLHYTEEEIEADRANVQLAGFLGEEVVASCALSVEGSRCQMLRVCVSPRLQRQGIATQMLALCEAYARKAGCSEVYCHARHTAYDFYLKHGYAYFSEPFIQSTIEHRRMRKWLEP